MYRVVSDGDNSNVLGTKELQNDDTARDWAAEVAKGPWRLEMQDHSGNWVFRFRMGRAQSL